MDLIVSIFHVDVKLLIAQALNFLIIFLILYFFAFKPISKIMQERTTTIEKSLDDAKKIEEKLSLAEAESQAILSRAQKEYSDIVNQAHESAEENRQKLIAKTKEEVAEIVKKEKENIQADKEAMLKELRGEVADLVVLATEKIIKEKLDSQKDSEIISKAIQG